MGVHHTRLWFHSRLSEANTISLEISVQRFLALDASTFGLAFLSNFRFWTHPRHITAMVSTHSFARASFLVFLPLAHGRMNVAPPWRRRCCRVVPSHRAWWPTSWLWGFRGVPSHVARRRICLQFTEDLPEANDGSERDGFGRRIQWTSGSMAAALGGVSVVSIPRIL